MPRRYILMAGSKKDAYRKKYLEYLNSNTGFFCFLFIIPASLLVIGAFTVSRLQGLVATAIPVTLFCCGIGWVLRYRQVSKRFKNTLRR